VGRTVPEVEAFVAARADQPHLVLLLEELEDLLGGKDASRHQDLAQGRFLARRLLPLGLLIKQPLQGGGIDHTPFQRQLAEGELRLVILLVGCLALPASDLLLPALLDSEDPVELLEVQEALQHQELAQRELEAALAGHLLVGDAAIEVGDWNVAQLDRDLAQAGRTIRKHHQRPRLLPASASEHGNTYAL
jgi:hypothetical protein